MNIFIDTTLTYQDPFFQTVTNKMLLKLVEVLDGKIYMSRVVIEETKEHLRKNMIDRIKKVKSDVDEYNKLTKVKLTIDIDEKIESYLTELDDFYTKLQEDDLLDIVEYSNDMLPVIVDRAIKRKKPFSDNKDEFRDTIIWLSYSKLVNENLLEKCYFITNNTSDYYAEDKTNIHPDLVGDCSNIKLVKSSKEIIESSDEEIRDARNSIESQLRLTEWISNNPINDDSVTKLLNLKCVNRIESYLQTYFMNGNIPRNMGYGVDYLELDTFEVIGADDIYYEIIDDEIYISGIMKVEAYTSAMVYNSVRDAGDNMYYDYGSVTVELELEFSLLHKGDAGVDSLEINRVWKFQEEQSEDDEY